MEIYRVLGWCRHCFATLTKLGGNKKFEVFERLRLRIVHEIRVSGNFTVNTGFGVEVNGSEIRNVLCWVRTIGCGG